MKVLSRGVFALASVLLLIGLVAGVVNRQVLDGGRFAGHVDAVRTDSSVARQMGLLVTDRVLEQQPDLTGLRPLIESASASLVASPALGPVVRSAVTPLHQALTSDSGGQVVFRLADVGALLVAAITTIAPDTQPVIPADLDVTLASIGDEGWSGSFIGVAHLVSVLSWLLPLLAFMLLAGSAGLRHREWRAVVRTVGGGCMAAAGLAAVLLVVGGFAISRVDDETMSGALTRAAWGELDGAFWMTMGVVGALGWLLRIAATPGFTLDLAVMGSQGWRGITTPAPSPAAEAVRGLGVMGAGVLIALRPLLVLSLLGGVVGFLLVLSGLRGLWRSIGQWWAQRSAETARTAVRFERSRRFVGLAGMLVWGAALVAVLVVSAIPGDSDLPAAAAAGEVCNGHVELCDRAYDEVAFPATHNSMSAADEPGWFLAEQPHGILRQLDDGIRVLLIDSWDAQETQRDGIVANAEKSRSTALAEAEKTYGAEVVQSALRLRDALNLTPTGPVKPYLCHALCELGSTEWEPLMEDVRGWLDSHPREVVTFFVQDEVSPADTAALVERAGLMPYVHVPEAGEPWPTLEEMIASGRRVVFLLENASGGTEHPWLIDSRVEVQDTPYAFTRASQFTCERFRGPADAPLFLINHWLSNYASRVTDAQRVNVADVLLSRARQCQDERGQIPNYIAVDNYDQGDLLDVVDELNGVS